MVSKREPFKPGYYYHIFNHSNGDENLFREEGNYYFFMKKFTEFIHPISNLFSFCLMLNHFHFFLQIKDEKELNINRNKRSRMDISDLISHQFGNLQNSYAKAYNKRYSRKGSLFNQSIKRKGIISKENLIYVVIYIHQNPVHHEFCLNPEDWKYSSFHTFLNKRIDKIFLLNQIVQKEDVINWFGDLNNFYYMHKSQSITDIKDF